MYDAESVAAYAVYVMAFILLELMYLAMRRRKLRALAVEAGFEVKELNWYERWIPAELPDKYARILEAILWTLTAFFLVMGWLYWNDIFIGTPASPLAASLITLLLGHLVLAVFTYWLERSYFSP